MCYYHRIRPLRQRPILPHVLVMDYKACYRLKFCSELLLALIEWPNITFSDRVSMKIMIFAFIRPEMFQSLC